MMNIFSSFFNLAKFSIKFLGDRDVRMRGAILPSTSAPPANTRGKRKRDADPDPEAEHPLKRRRLDPALTRNWEEWVSASATRNYLLNDPLLDWLNYHHTTLATRNPGFSAKIIKSLASKKEPTNFTEFIMAQGKIFEGKVVEALNEKFSSLSTPTRQRSIDIGGDHTNVRTQEKVDATFDAMLAGCPIIYNAVLHSVEDQTYGIPDILVRSDWLSKLVTITPIFFEDETTPAPNLPGARYHYRVIDIKYSTLHLCADATGLLNGDRSPRTKARYGSIIKC